MESAEQLRAMHGIDEADLDRVREYGQRALGGLGEHLRRFFAWMETTPEYEHFFGDETTLPRVHELLGSYWGAFFEGQIDEGYVAYRRTVGEVHARIGLPLQVFQVAFARAFDLWTEGAGQGADWQGLDAAATVRSMGKLMHLDMALMSGAFVERSGKTIAEQNRWLMAMSTPISVVWEKLLLVPLVGVVDSKRAADVRHAVLKKVGEVQARVAILDIRGIPLVDTAVANHLIKITKATRLMGCESIVSGLSPAVAETIVELGIDVERLMTTATLSDALETALARLGYAVGPVGAVAPGAPALAGARGAGRDG